MKRLVLIVLVLLIACQPPLTRGYIIDREFSPAHTTMLLIPQVYTSCFGSPPVCTTSTFYIYVPQFYPDTWRIRVENGDREEWVEVNETEWNSLVEGDFWVAPSPAA